MPRRNRRIAARAATALGLVAFLVPPGMASPAVTRAVPPEPGPALQLGPAATGDPVIAAAGDISLPPPVDPTAGSKRTSDAILAMDPAPATVLTLGDNQYGGQLSDYNGSGAFHATWGRFKSKIRPAFGDEDRTPSGSDAGYYAYFNDGNGDGPAGPNGRGYYSFDVGAWHIVVLNSETDHEASSPQADWLRADLAAHPSTCTLATLHRPLFTSNQSSTGMKDLVEILYGSGVDLLLSGNIHSYERFAKQNPDGLRDDARGIRQFVVGTGGHSTGGLDPDKPNSETRGDVFGVLKLTLHASSYDWQFVEAARTAGETGGTQEETGGTDNCVMPITQPPPAPMVTSVEASATFNPGTSGTAIVNGTNFTGTPTVDFGAGVTVTSVSLVSAQRLHVGLKVAANASPGTRDVTVRNPAGAAATCNSCFRILAPGEVPPVDPQPKAGYWLVAADGGIFAFGEATFKGSTGNLKLAQPIVGMAPTPSGNGYLLVARDGGIFAFGDAKFHGSTGNLKLAKPIVGMATTPSGNGYWLVAADGGMFAFGDAKFHGSTGNLKLAQPIVGMATTPSGNGYLLVARDGGIFAFGDAKFHGSTGNIRLAKPIVGMTATPTGRGYLLVASDGGIFAFGDAAFKGSTGNMRLNQPIVSMAATPTGNGYWLTASDGGIFNFGDASFEGSTGALKLTSPIVGMTPTPKS